MLQSISPVDGRYENKTAALKDYFSEYALIKYRVFVEIRYFIALSRVKHNKLPDISKSEIKKLQKIASDFSVNDAERIKEIEKVTNHDVKAVEYFLKDKFDKIGLSKYKEFIHFGLTSQDINNTAFPLSLKDAVIDVYIPFYQKIYSKIVSLAESWKDIPMLAHTHGQPATPTLLGKEFLVFAERLDEQLKQLKKIPFNAKFGGATGNFNAHYVAFPDIDWHKFGDDFIEKKLKLKRSKFTTQIEHYDNLAAVFHTLSRINTILIDMCRDIWTYISMEYFKQKVVKNEVGSSAMPHKVNPIDFENAEGNLGIANANFYHLASKLPVSRLQRDLTDSTVLRNAGVPFGHTIIAFSSILKGLDKLLLNKNKLKQDLDKNWIIISEAIQNILRREGYPKPYEALKELTRGKSSISKTEIHNFIDNLNISTQIKNEMKKITPFNYVGKTYNTK